MPTERGPQPTSIVLVYGADHGPGIYTEEIEWSAAVERAAKALAAINADLYPIARFPKSGYHEDWDKWVLPDQDAFRDYARAALRAAGEGDER